MADIKLNEEEFQDEYLFNGLDAFGKFLELAKAYCANLRKFESLTKDEKTKIYLTLAPFLKDYMLEHGQNLKMKNNS